MGEPGHREEEDAGRGRSAAARAHLPVGRLADGDLRALRDRFLADPRGTDISALRPVIERSWRRSRLFEVDPGLQTFPAICEPHVDELLLRCCEPVLAGLERIADDQGAGVCLADAAGTLVAFRGHPATVRRAGEAFPLVGAAMTEAAVGTNAEGTALEEGISVQTWGAEHFADGMQSFCCTSVPIRDPLRRSIRAFVSLALPRRLGASADPRSVALIVEGAAAELTRLLADRLAVREQALLAAYLTESRKRGADAVVVLDERTTIATKGALELLEQSDLAVLAGYAREAERRGQPVEREVVVGADTVVRLDLQPIVSGGECIGSVARLRRVAESASGGTRSARLRADPFHDVVGESLALRRALDVAAAAVERRLPAIVLGERGTGRRLLATAMAAELGPGVVAIACASRGGGAAADVAAALARGAAVVLVDVEALPDRAIAELVGVLGGVESPPIVLTAAAMSDALLALVLALRGVEVELPPLRKRRDDVPLLAAALLRRAGHDACTVSPGLLRALAEADWPGNIAQLRQVLEGAATRAGAGELRSEHLADEHRRILARAPLSRLEEAELAQIRDAVAEAGGNRARAAQMLQIGRSTLYRKLEAYARRGYAIDG